MYLYHRFIGKNRNNREHIRAFWGRNPYSKFLFTVGVFIVCLIYLKPYIGSYSYISNWLQTISLVGVFLQVVQWQKHTRHALNNKINWEAIPNYSTNNNSDTSIIDLKNLSGKSIRHVNVRLSMLNVTQIRGGSPKFNRGVVTKAGKKVGIKSVSFGFSWDRQCKEYDLNLKYRSDTPTITYGKLFNIFKQCMPYSFGKYKLLLNFYCYQNYQSQTFKVLYNYEKTEEKSNILNMIKL